MELRPLLEQLERDPNPEAGLAFLAAQELRIEDDDLRGARRRALLLLAAGGDPRRDLDVDGRAVGSVAADLDTPERRAALSGSLEALRRAAGGLPAVEAALGALLADPDRAWRWLACALLAEELAEA